jgi:hypothetical protein
MYALVEVGPAPVTVLSAHVDEPVGVVSYHLRQLARYQIAEEVPELARDRREHWWRFVPHRGFAFHPSDFADDPIALAAGRAVERKVSELYLDMINEWSSQAYTWPMEWQDAAFGNGVFLKLTAAELAQFGEELHEVLVRWSDRAEAAVKQGDTEGRETVFYMVQAHPRRSQRGTREG